MNQYTIPAAAYNALFALATWEANAPFEFTMDQAEVLVAAYDAVLSEYDIAIGWPVLEGGILVAEDDNGKFVELIPV